MERGNALGLLASYGFLYFRGHSDGGGPKNGVVVGTISPGGRRVRKWEVRQVTRNVGEVCADGVERRHTVIHFEAKVELTKHN